VGDYRYRDLNGDGHLTDADKTMIGNVNPDYIFGITNRVRFGRFDLSAFGSRGAGQQHHQCQPAPVLGAQWDERQHPDRVLQERVRSGDEPTGKYPRIDADRVGVGLFSDAFVEDGSYIRLKNLQLGYDCRPGSSGHAHGAAYLSAINLFTITGYTGFDPEVSAFSTTDMRGVDLGSYPQSRVFTAGVTLTF